MQADDKGLVLEKNHLYVKISKCKSEELFLIIISYQKLKIMARTRDAG